MPPLVVDLDGLPREDVLGELEEGHVRAPPRAVDREEADSRTLDAEEVAVGVRHDLGKLLRRGVDRNLGLSLLFLTEGGLVLAVDAAARREDEVIHLVVPAKLEERQRAEAVRPFVAVRVGERVAHPCLGREVTDLGEASFSEDPLHRLLVSDVRTVEGESLGVLELLEARPLQLHVVVG